MQAREPWYLGLGKPAGLLRGASEDQRSAAEGGLLHSEAALQVAVQLIETVHEVHPSQPHPTPASLLLLCGQPLQLTLEVRRMIRVAEAVDAH